MSESRLPAATNTDRAHQRILAGSSPMIDEFAKEYLHGDLQGIREAMLWKLDGLSEYDIRRPLTATGTNLLGLIKHLSTGGQVPRRGLRPAGPRTTAPVGRRR